MKDLLIWLLGLGRELWENYSVLKGVSLKLMHGSLHLFFFFLERCAIAINKSTWRDLSSKLCAPTNRRPSC